MQGVENVSVHRVDGVGQLSQGLNSQVDQWKGWNVPPGEAAGRLAYLVRVAVEVKILQEAGGEFTEERVVRVVDGSQAPVGVVVGAGARAEWTHCTRTEMECGQ